MTHLPPWGVPPPWSPRPPSVSWPPCPPWPPPRPVLSPPDIAQALKLLQQMFASTEAFQALVKQAVEQILVADPTWLAGATPTVGVTDGVDAQPGMVGEFLRWQLAIPYTTAEQLQIVNVGVLPAGDWDVWGWAFSMTPSTGINVVLQPPRPAGIADAMHGMFIVPAGEVAQFIVVCPATRALLTQPTPLVFEVITNQGGASSVTGTVSLIICARRRR